MPMRLPRVRFTVRRIMLAVLAVALALFAYRELPSLRDLFEEGPYHAASRVVKSWDCGTSPSVTVDVFEGSIYVLPSADGRVTADIFSVSVTKRSQWAANDALKTIDVTMNQKGDTVRVLARGASEGRDWMGYIRKETHVTLHVPKGVRLDLRTGRGEIRVGRDHAGNTPVHRPISADSVRARNESEGSLGYAEGNIIIETVAPPCLKGGSPTPTRIQVDAPGHVEILADFAIVEARAWHGVPPAGWTQTEYEGQDEGSIMFEGSLAEGSHSLRAAHRIAMKLRVATALRVSAEAAGGRIEGDLIPKPVEQRNGRSMWKGSLGSGQGGEIHIRTDDGSITLDTTP